MKVVKKDVGKKFKKKGDIVQVGKTIEASMSLFGTDMDRSTHYNTKEELESARSACHDSMFSVDRSIYGCIMCLPGVTDNSKMTAVLKMLDNPWVENGSLLTSDHERMILDNLISTLPANRMINLFVKFDGNKINNERMRKSALPFILNSKSLEWWSVKYKRKLRQALTHCWGQKRTSVIINIIKKKNITQKEINILNDNILKHLVHNNSSMVFECLAFIFSAWDERRYLNKLFKSFYAARTDFKQAAGLPKETIEGIRCTYHPDITSGEALKVAEKSMTSKEKKLVQNKAKKAGVEIKWNPFAQPLVELFIYGFQMGFDQEVQKAITTKAKAAASSLPFHYDHVGIICDDSFSMSGSEDQKLKALAITYATVEMLKRVGTKCTVATTSGREFKFNNSPVDGTDLATPLMNMLKFDPDAIFVISDGYENAPEGRFAELLKIAQERLSIITPVYHFNPVAAAESSVALKRLSDDIPLTPVTNPEKMGLTLFKTMLSVDPRGGIIELFNIMIPQLEATKQLYARRKSETKELEESK